VCAVCDVSARSSCRTSIRAPCFISAALEACC
jgi:hypothetical protein